MAEYVATQDNDLANDELVFALSFWLSSKKLDARDFIDTGPIPVIDLDELEKDFGYFFREREERDKTDTLVNGIPVIQAEDVVPEEVIEDFLPVERSKVSHGRRYAIAAVLGLACGAVSYGLVYEASQIGHESDNVITNREVDLCLIAIKRDNTSYTATSLPAECTSVASRFMLARASQQASADNWTALANDAKVNWLERFEQEFKSEQIAIECALVVGGLATVTLTGIMSERFAR